MIQLFAFILKIHTGSVHSVEYSFHWSCILFTHTFCARLDRPQAITATAHKLARLIYAMLIKGTEYMDQGQDYYEKCYQQRVVHSLSQRAEKLGFQLAPISQG